MAKRRRVPQHELMLTTLILSALLTLGATHSAPCEDKTLYSYHYESFIHSFANASKTVRFQSDFQLQCIRNIPDDNSKELIIVFTRLRHAIHDDAPPPTRTRKRKPPPRTKQSQRNEAIPIEQKQLVAETHTTYEADNSYRRRSADKFDQWNDLSLEPVKFIQHFTGAISTFTASYIDRGNSNTYSLKRSIAQLFQTNTRLEKPEVTEYTELGEHRTLYRFRNGTDDPGLLEVEKVVRPEMFIKMQNSDINEGNIKVASKGKQKIQDDIVLSSELTIRTKMTKDQFQVDSVSFNKQEDMRAQFSVTVMSDIQLTGRTGYGDITHRATFLGSPRSAEEMLEDETDPLKYMEVTLKQSSQMLERFNIRAMLNIFERDTTKLDILRPLQTALDAEGHLYVARRLTDRPVFRRAFPLLLERLESCLVVPDWRFCVNVLQTALQTGESGLEKYLMGLLEHPAAFSLATNRLINVAMFQRLPTDQMLQALRDFRASSESEELRSHLLLTIGAVGSRHTISPAAQRDTALFLLSEFNLAGVAKECNITQDGQLQVIDALGNFIGTTALDHVGADVADQLTGEIAQLVKTCHYYEQDVPLISAITALVKAHKHANVIPQLLDIIQEGSCDRKLQIVEGLIKLMDYKREQWPARHVNEVDYILAADYLSQNPTVACARSTLHSYFKRKHLTPDTPKWNELFKRIYNSPELVRRRRQTELTGYSFDLIYLDWFVGEEDKYAVIQSASKFQQDKVNYPTRKHLLADVTVGIPYLSLYMRAGFFTGKDPSLGTLKLFGKAVIDVQVGLIINLADIEFIREQVVVGGSAAFNGRVVLKAIGYTYLDYTMYHCNHTIDDLSWAYTFTTPAWSLSFAGFGLTMGASFEVRFIIYLWPSYCEDGDHGVRWKPLGIVQADAYAEIGYDPYFGIGASANAYFDYFIDALIRLPDACMFIYHGNNDMSFSISFYLKLPEFKFVNINPTPIVSQKLWNVFRWLLVMKRGGKWTLFGYCPPIQIYEPEIPTWDFDTTI